MAADAREITADGGTGLLRLVGDSSDGWERPRPDAAQRRRDVLSAVLGALLTMALLAASESFAGAVEGHPRWTGYLMVAVLWAPMAVRRSWPTPVLISVTGVYTAMAYLAPGAAAQATTIVAYFVTLHTVVAWERSRRLAALAVVGLALFLMVWVVLDLTVLSSYDAMLQELDSTSGPLPPGTGYAAYMGLVNAVFFTVAVVLGRSSWIAARRRARLVEQFERIRLQSRQLAEQAVVRERLRIARELHDVIAHHVSAIGIQAGAARMVLKEDPDRAANALRSVEGSARDAVAETRQLLGVLRREGSGDGPEGAAPEPGLMDLPALAEASERAGLPVMLRLVSEREGELERVPSSVGLSAYRCVQEALTNVRRHSTARRASAVVRTLTEGRCRWLEAEIVDDGSPRGGTTQSGHGLSGVRERAALHGGQAEIGPRVPGPGWRVRVRFPLPARMAG